MFLLRFPAALAAFAGVSLYGIGLALVRRDRSNVAHDYARAMQRVMHPILGLTVEVRGRENLLGSRPCVYVVNHQSAFDVPILSGLYPDHTVLVAKKELRSIPLFGWLYEATGNILIDRASNPQAVQRLREAADTIRATGVSVWIFPEGTRSRVPGQLLPFKKGGFHLAVSTTVPIVPIVVSPVRELFDVRHRRVRPGTIRVHVLEPVPTSGSDEADLPRLMDDVWGRMDAVLREMRSEPRDV